MKRSSGDSAMCSRGCACGTCVSGVLRGIGCFVAFCSGVQLLRCVGCQQVHTGSVAPQNAQTIVEGQDLVTPGSPRPCGFGVVGQVQAGDHRPIPARVGGDLVTVELGKALAGWGSAPAPCKPSTTVACRPCNSHQCVPCGPPWATPHHGAVVVQQQQGACGLRPCPVGMGHQRVGGKAKRCRKRAARPISAWRCARRRQLQDGFGVRCTGVVQRGHGVSCSARTAKGLHPPLPAPWPAQVERRQRRVGCSACSA